MNEPNTFNVQYRPASANFFSKTGGQFQFAVGSPTWKPPESTDGKSIAWVKKNGAVFVEAAPPDPSNPGKLDWRNNKVVLALSDKDIGDLLYAIKKNKPDNDGVLAKIFHSNEDRSIVKTFRIAKGNGDTYKLSLTLKSPSKSTSVNVYVTASDIMRLVTLLQSALPMVLGWDKV